MSKQSLQPRLLVTRVPSLEKQFEDSISVDLYWDLRIQLGIPSRRLVESVFWIVQMRDVVSR